MLNLVFTGKALCWTFYSLRERYAKLVIHWESVVATTDWISS